MQISAVTALLGMALSMPALAQQQPQQPQQPLPDAPSSQQTTAPITDAATGPIRPGGGSGTETSAAGSSGSQDVQVPQPATQPPPAQKQQDQQQTPPQNLTPAEIGAQIRINVTYVTVPVTVKDSKGNEVPGLEWRDFRVYENNNFVPLRIFSTDSFPLSIAFVVDNTLPRDVMAQVNDSLGAIQGAMTPYDEIAVFTYGNGARNQSGGFTGGQSARVPFILSMAKSAGTEQLNPVNDGPFASCNIRQNGNCVDPNLQSGRSAGNGTFMNIPKTVHTLNDAILAAAKELSTRPRERRRIIYVISDGKEYGSQAKYRDVLRYLQTNHIMVYGSLVGEAARWGEGRLSRIHLPGTMYDNRLVGYTLATGGSLDSANGTIHLERTYADLTREARTRYTLVYASHEPLLDEKFRSIDVRVNRPNLEVIAPRGYYPSATDANNH
jgi:VWFA-related protein